MGIGRWSFIIGAALAIIAGLASMTQSWVPTTLLILGAVVGLLNITEKESQSFLISGIALLLLSPSIGGILGGVFGEMLKNVAVFVAPAVFITAIRSVYNLAQD